MRLRRLTAAAALMLVASLTAPVWAACIADIGMTHGAQMACCEHGHEKCPMHGTAQDCCGLEAQRHHQVSTALHEALRPAVNPPVVVATPVLTPVVPAIVRLARSTSRPVIKAPDPPPYLLGSAFLV